MTSAAPLMSVVDDDLSMREAISWVLRANGWRTETYDSATAFLEGGTDPRPDCIVLDVRMPGMSGVELQRKLRELPGTPPVIVVSGHLTERLEKQMLSAGAVACLRKPFTEETLLQAVRQALER
jgi:FixJ family two-component response regulator